MNTKVIYLAGGCFWGTEHFIKQIQGVISTETGFANGHTEHPTYKEVYTDTTGYTVPKSGTVSAEYQFTPLKAKLTKITVTAVVELEGKEYTFTKDVELDVKDADSLVYVGIDASHYNEYVSGNYKDSMGNFALLASEYSVRVVTLETSEDLIAVQTGQEKGEAVSKTEQAEAE